MRRVAEEGLRPLAFLGILAALLAGCEKPPPPFLPPPPSPPPLAEPDLLPSPAEPPVVDPAQPATPIVAAQEDVIAITPPANPAPLRWDFAEGKRHVYEFTQTLRQHFERELHDVRDVKRTRDRNRGIFQFASARPGVAKVTIKVETEEAWVNDEAVVKEVLQKRDAAKFECLLRDDGTPLEIKKLGDESSDAEIFFDALLPITPGEKKLKDGTATTKLTGYFKVEHHECARLETVFEYRPRTEHGRSLMRGRTVAYFALQDRCLVRAQTTCSLSSRGRALDDKGRWVVNRLDTETSFSLKLIEK